VFVAGFVLEREQPRHESFDRARPPETDEKGKMHGFSINSAPDDPELTFTRTRLALAGGDLDAHSFRSLEKILKQRRTPRLARKLNSEFGS